MLREQSIVYDPEERKNSRFWGTSWIKCLSRCRWLCGHLTIERRLQKAS
jgi:hypothetical protein